MQKIALAPLQDTAVGFYRILQPGRVMKREGYFKEARSLPFTGEHKELPNYKDATYLYLTERAEIIWSNIVYHPDLMLKFLNLRKLNKSKVTVVLSMKILILKDFGWFKFQLQCFFKAIYRSSDSKLKHRIWKWISILIR